MPSLSSLTFRPLRGPADYAPLAELITLSNAADLIEETVTADEVANEYLHQTESNPATDVLLAEVDNQLIGYAYIWQRQLDTDERVYRHIGFVHPAWRRRGLGRELLHWSHTRLTEMAAAAPGVIRVMAEDTAYGKAPLFEQAGYAPIRYFFFMQRKPLEDLPAAPLPPGLELRPALPGHLRLLWEAKQEAFRDHWGHFTDTEADYQIWLNDPHNDLSLWQIAWDGDQVAGVAFNFINANDNAHYGFQRGQVRSLAVRRPWRGRGLGRALLVHSLHAHRERGMTEATLGVDAENPSGALKLYESVGFTVLNKDVLYQKQIP